MSQAAPVEPQPPVDADMAKFASDTSSEASKAAGDGEIRGTVAQGPPAGADRQGAAALALLQLLADMRKTQNLHELGYFIANEMRSALRAQQIVVFDLGTGLELTVHTVSSLTTVDRSSPLVLWFESIVKDLKAAQHLDKIREFEAAAFAGQYAAVQRTYPLRYMLWVPWISRDGTVSNGMLLTRAAPWGDNEIKIASYLARAFALAWSSFGRSSSVSFLPRLMSRRALAVAAGVIAMLLLIPVPMTALAPVEVEASDSFVVTPGVEGVIRTVEVEPNAAVRAGELLVTLNDTVLRNRADIAEREALLADSKYKKAAQLAFIDARGRHEMAVARSELDLKLAELDYARQLLQRTEIRAERDGVAFFADKRDLVGKPVVVGEKLMEVANPATSQFRIELPVADAIVLRDQARVKVFLDSDPLNPVEAKLVRAAYKAAPREAQQFAYRLVAQADAPQTVRLGMRGTAQIYSDRVPLGFYLFRRPIAAARQWSGI
jgi:multidrug efflux pump subunit AcrA (membrane-fusion protein)